MSIHEDWADRCRELARRIREHCLRMTHRGHSGHVGSMLSMAEMLSVLYTRVLKVDPAAPRRPDRDRFVLSKDTAAVPSTRSWASWAFSPGTGSRAITAMPAG